MPKDGLDQLPVLLEFVQHTDVLNQCGIDSQPRRQRVHTYSKADEKVPTLEYTPIKRRAPSTVAERMSSMCTGMRCTKDSTSCPILNRKKNGFTIYFYILTLESGIEVGPTVINLAFFSRPYGLIRDYIKVI